MHVIRGTRGLYQANRRDENAPEKSYVETISQCFPKFFARGTLVAAKRTTTDPHILAHVNTEWRTKNRPAVS